MHGILEKGGVASYIHRISTAQRAAGHTVYYMDSRPHDQVQAGLAESLIFVQDDAELFAQARALELDILHVHWTISKLPPDHVPIVRTVHGHHPYCPSGSRYLERWDSACDRAYSLAGCLWGHLVDRCGSARPQNLYANFQNTRLEMATLSHFPVIAVSRFLKDQMIRSGYSENLIQILYSPAAISSEYTPPPAEDVPHFVFLGRIVPQKGLAWLLQALRAVKVPMHLDIAGDGFQKSAMRRLGDSLGVAGKVTFHGWVSEEQTRKLLQAARALVCPSVWHEPAGLVGIEAAAAGRAVIGSRAGAIPEYVLHRQTGLLVNPHDVPGLAQSLEKLALDHDLAKRLGEAGRKMAETRFTMKEHLHGLMSLYELAGQDRGR